jgi:hypothetical protein
MAGAQSWVEPGLGGARHHADKIVPRPDLSWLHCSSCSLCDYLFRLGGAVKAVEEAAHTG